MRGRADEGHGPRRRGLGVTQVNGFTGSSIWHLLYSFPPNDFAAIERGYQEFAERWGPIIDVFDAEGVRFGLEVHPDRDRLRLRHDAQDARRDRTGEPRSASTSTRATSRTSSSTPRRSARVRATASTTSTSRTRGRRLDGRRSILGSHLNFGDEAPRLGLRLARPRRRRLRGLLPRAEPDRLPGPALDRVGRLRHGSRIGRAGRAGVRAPHGLRAVGGRLRRRDAAEGGLTWRTRRGSPRGPGRSAGTIAEIGVGMLGYAFMGKAHVERVPDAGVHGLAAAVPAAAGGDRRTRRGRGHGGGAPLRVRARGHRLARPRRRPGDRPLRQRRPERPSRRADHRSGGGGQARDLREAARPRRGGVARHLASASRRRASCTCARSTTASCRQCDSPDS